MSNCSKQEVMTLPQSAFERTCPTCKFKITNQFITKCPRCATKLSLAELCTGCYQSGACHSDSEKKSPLISITLPK
jgi:hypothetical protein